MLFLPQLHFLRRPDGKGVMTRAGIAKGRVVWQREGNHIRLFPLDEYKALLKRSQARSARIVDQSFPMEILCHGHHVRFLCLDTGAGHCIAHSDCPNLRYDPEQGTLTALRSIRPGEELTRNYRECVPDLNEWKDVEHCASFLSAPMSSAKAA